MHRFRRITESSSYWRVALRFRSGRQAAAMKAKEEERRGIAILRPMGAIGRRIFLRF
jgi:hypothetical protein